MSLARAGLPGRERWAGTTARRAGACLLALSALACADPEPWARPTDVVARLSEQIPTVVSVSWTTEEPTVGYVEYGAEGALDWSTPFETEPSRTHSVALLGLRADTTYRYRVVTWDGDDAGASEVGTLRTGALPSDAPRFTASGSGFESYVVVPLRDAGAIAILDLGGRVVWYYEDARDVNTGLDILRARLSSDGRSVLYNRVSFDPASTAGTEIFRVALDGSRTSATHASFLAYDFVELPNQTLALIRPETRAGVRGDSIVEVNTSGNETTVWSAWDCFDPAAVPGTGADGAWTYANALAYVEREDAYYVGLRNLSSVVKVDRQSGDCAWVLGGPASTLAFASGSTPFARQSGFTVSGDELLLLDNDGGGNASRVVEYELDFDAGTATQTGSYASGLSVAELGEVTLQRGNWFVNWGSEGRFELVTGNGDPLWELDAVSSERFGYHTLTDSLYLGDVRTPELSP